VIIHKDWDQARKDGTLVRRDNLTKGTQFLDIQGHFYEADDRDPLFSGAYNSYLLNEALVQIGVTSHAGCAEVLVVSKP
jgi:hypothetical protein